MIAGIAVGGPGSSRVLFLTTLGWVMQELMKEPMTTSSWYTKRANGPKSVQDRIGL